MSVKVSAWVWENAPESIKDSELLMLLCLAEHAGEDGVCWPTIARLAKRCRIGERQAARLIAALEKAGAITVQRGTGRGNPSMYLIKGDMQGQRVTPTTPFEETKVTPTTPFSETRVTPTTPFEEIKGDISSIKGDISSIKGDMPSHARELQPLVKPSVEPSVKTTTTTAPPPPRPNAFAVYETEIGLLTASIADILKVDLEENPPEWVEDAIREAARQNKRSMSYVHGILRRWKREGRGDTRSNGSNGSAPAEVGITGKWDSVIIRSPVGVPLERLDPASINF